MTRPVLYVIFWGAFAGMIVVSLVLAVNGAVLVLAVAMAASGGLLLGTRGVR